MTLPDRLAALKPTRAFVLVDENTAAHCLPRLRREVPVLAKAEVITIPAGERHKTIGTTEAVWRALVDARADRRAVLVNLGGGVVTDLGGYAAACYKRGIRFVHVPTTLLGMVDAALGGKTGVDFGGVKNAVGAFRMPEYVHTDVAYLQTLPPRELRSGAAEMYKHALIRDAAHWEEMKATAAIWATASSGEGEVLAKADLTELVRRSQRIKLDVVAQDPEEKGVRECLNYGHSVGHAIESVLLTGAHPALHGEAIAAGMICEAYLSQELAGLSVAEVQDIEETLLGVYGKLAIRANHLVSLLALVANDKKNVGGEVRMSLLRRIGEPRLSVRVKDEQVAAAVERYLRK